MQYTLQYKVRDGHVQWMDMYSERGHFYDLHIPWWNTDAALVVQIHVYGLDTTRLLLTQTRWRQVNGRLCYNEAYTDNFPIGAHVQLMNPPTTQVCWLDLDFHFPTYHCQSGRMPLYMYCFWTNVSTDHNNSLICHVQYLCGAYVPCTLGTHNGHHTCMWPWDVLTSTLKGISTVTWGKLYLQNFKRSKSTKAPQTYTHIHNKL